jgi:hypothetical protein
MKWLWKTILSNQMDILSFLDSPSPLILLNSNCHAKMAPDSGDIQNFGAWLDDAKQSGIYAMQRFARTVRRDLDAVTNALTEEWSNGQTEGHINRLKTLKRAMYGRAGAELLRARMLPLHSSIKHGK